MHPTSIHVSENGEKYIRNTYPFTVDSYFRIFVDTTVLHLIDVAHFLHVRGVTPCPKDARDLCLGVHVV